MVVKLDDARITISLDIRRATAEIREVESQLEKARRRRRGIVPRVDPGKDARVAGRNLAAVGAFGAGRAVQGGLRKAIGFAAKAGILVSGAQFLREAPAFLPDIVNLLPKDVAREEFPPVPDFVAPFLRARGLPNVASFIDLVDRVNSLEKLAKVPAKAIAELEAIVLSTMDAVRILSALAGEGHFVKGGIKAGSEIAKAFQQARTGEFVSPDLSLPDDVANIFDAFTSENRARSLQKQYAKRVEASIVIENQLEAVRTGGGGANR